MFNWDDALLTEVCCVVILVHERFVQDEKFDRIDNEKCPKNRETRLYRYRSIIRNNLCRRDNRIDMRLFGHAHRCVVVYVILKYDPMSLDYLCATFWRHYSLSKRREPFINRRGCKFQKKEYNTYSLADVISVPNLSEPPRLRIPAFKFLFSRVHLIWFQPEFTGASWSLYP
jgi:hypothetical protein